MALVTYGTRAGGLWLVSLVRETPLLGRILRHLGTSVLAALLVAGLREGDAGITIGAVAAFIVMRLTGNMLAAIGIAAGCAALTRLMTG
jgi:branched-subunit amino acid transport protein